MSTEHFDIRRIINRIPGDLIITYDEWDYAFPVSKTDMWLQSFAAEFVRDTGVHFLDHIVNMYRGYNGRNKRIFIDENY
jgi:hypothetical protein